MGWQALLEGTLKDRAEQTVQAIVEAIAGSGPDAAGDPSLAGGTSGLALLDGYLALSQHRPDHAALAERQLHRTITAVTDSPTSASLHSGLTGVGWALAHLRDRLPDLDGEDDLGEIDEVLLQHLDQA